ncbi:TlyA family RNA methyltransferase [Luteipulveratus flavus]|uniref:TlyA family RNA methyltransferase n=1 Tax=Luteipulveratus flavus TaxID=3031728 RepID=A0ABT6C5I1_9MICO|nr:TlyA family RNA methyltransferase [Luteipulveratus sp. YIM 133296]MDF8264198.1 TlyA family RNA methyltransferase [Luteipulveratus sp. YIM 133296]
MTAAPDRAERLDVALVSRGLARSRAQAQEWISAGQVRIGDRTAHKASERVSDGQELVVDSDDGGWVGRAAHKLVGALEAFVPVAAAVPGARCVDVGASTGGFTQVLLRQGAGSVVALDVGHGQLVPQIADDPRVEEVSGTNVRDVSAASLGGAADVVVSDLSFISLTLVMAQLADLTAPTGHLVVLVKPQFEVGRQALGKGGVVRSGRLRADAVRDVVDAARSHDLAPHGLAPSPLVGGTGNQEYLLWLRHTTAGMMAPMDLETVLDRITGEAR